MGLIGGEVGGEVGGGGRGVDILSEGGDRAENKGSGGQILGRELTYRRGELKDQKRE